MIPSSLWAAPPGELDGEPRFDRNTERQKDGKSDDTNDPSRAVAAHSFAAGKLRRRRCDYPWDGYPIRKSKQNVAGSRVLSAHAQERPELYKLQAVSAPGLLSQCRRADQSARLVWTVLEGVIGRRAADHAGFQLIAEPIGGSGAKQ